MRNRAKCKLCGDIIESTYRHDMVSCSCGEISVDGGNDYHRAVFNNKENFIKIDDEGNEIIPTIRKGEPDVKEILETIRHKPTKKELIKDIEYIVKGIESLPIDVKMSPMNHIDYMSLLRLLSDVLHAD